MYQLNVSCGESFKCIPKSWSLYRSLYIYSLAKCSLWKETPCSCLDGLWLWVWRKASHLWWKLIITVSTVLLCPQFCVLYSINLVDKLGWPVQGRWDSNFYFERATNGSFVPKGQKWVAYWTTIGFFKPCENLFRIWICLRMKSRHRIKCITSKYAHAPSIQADHADCVFIFR